MKDLFEEIADFVKNLPYKTWISPETKGALVYIECLNFLLVMDIKIHEKEKVLCINGTLPMDEPPDDYDLVAELLEKNSPAKLDYLFEFHDLAGGLMVHHHIDISKSSVRPGPDVLQKVFTDLKHTLEKSYAPIAFRSHNVKHSEILLDDKDDYLNWDGNGMLNNVN